MKNLLLLFAFIASQAFAQTDFRSAKWGMSMEQVKNSETAPLSNSEKSPTGSRDGKMYYEGYDLTYEGVTVGGKKGDLYYHFDNGRLTKIRVVFRHDLYTNYKESLSKIVTGFKDLFDALINRGFRYTSPLQSGIHVYFGADDNNPDNKKIFEMKDWSITPEVLRLNEKMIAEKHYKASFFRIENSRSRGSVMFATEYSEFKDTAPITMELTPSFQVENDIKKSDF